MSIKRIDYKEAREYYIKGEGDEYPSLYDVAREFKYSLSTLRKKAAMQDPELAKLRTDAGVDLDSQELVFLVE